MIKILFKGAAILAAIIFVSLLMWLSSSDGTRFNSNDTKTRLAEDKAYHMPVFVDFTKTGWDKGLYLADYTNEQHKFYRVGFEPSAIKTTPDGVKLIISESDGTKKWDRQSAEVQVKHQTGYGFYEVIMKPAAGAGLISSFFTYTGPYFGDPHDEIDIEFLGKNRNEVEFNTYTAGKASGGIRHELDYNASEEFHLYAFDWQPGSVKFYIDGEFMHEISGPRQEMPTHAGKIMVNVWTGTLTDWHGDAEFESGVASHYRCVAYRPTGDNVSTMCSDTLHRSDAA